MPDRPDDLGAAADRTMATILASLLHPKGDGEVSWSEVVGNRIICHRGSLPECGVCGCGIPPKADIGRTYGGIPLCQTCSADVDASAAFKTWAEHQINTRFPLSGSLVSGEKP
jgi:hypothetical protein